MSIRAAVTRTTPAWLRSPRLRSSRTTSMGASCSPTVATIPDYITQCASHTPSKPDHAGSALDPGLRLGRTRWIYVSSPEPAPKGLQGATVRRQKTLMPYAAHLWSGGREEAWNLDILCTHPDFEGKKHGSFLVTVGEAEGDGVCTSVIAPWGKFGFKGAGRADVGPIAWVSTIIFRDKITTIIFRDKITRGRRR
ncbi:hypothetical protein GMDG_06540 [Pseudogymnoascus destructans 20631-21]|uniref:Uncharacterized protein n=1 Tax=Pseudogymnoascus destructans (strain ATCC MYA-4855 / 20631-21) TaxID=658429 RepID=L8FU22_PSED2|nr:hypothetical protein GMDG_06540 [Pseudogymnoascus destructans 20631-21]